MLKILLHRERIIEPLGCIALAFPEG